MKGEGDRDALGKEGGHEMVRREGETERNERRKEGRKEGRQTGRQIAGYTEREFCSRYALSMRPGAPPQPPRRAAPRRFPRRWLTRGPLICDPDPPYLNNPGYGFHLSSQDAHPHPRTLTYIHEESSRGTCRGKGCERGQRRGASTGQTGAHASFVSVSISHAFFVPALLARRSFLPNT